MCELSEWWGLYRPQISEVDGQGRRQRWIWEAGSFQCCYPQRFREICSLLWPNPNPWSIVPHQSQRLVELEKQSEKNILASNRNIGSGSSLPTSIPTFTARWWHWPNLQNVPLQYKHSSSAVLPCLSRGLRFDALNSIGWSTSSFCSCFCTNFGGNSTGHHNSLPRGIMGSI